MNLWIPQIAWSSQDKERILSLDMHPYDSNKLITAGSDINMNTENMDEMVGYIKFWELQGQKWVFTNAINYGHIRNVNCIKYDYSGEQFATCSDDKYVKVWAKRMRTDFGQKEQTLMWSDYKTLIGHSSEVYDLQWSRDGRVIVSCELKCFVIIWDVQKGKQLQTLDGHTSYVQGVAIDPKRKYILSLSMDRSSRVYCRVQDKKSLKSLQYYTYAVIKKLEQPGQENRGMFLGDISSFFRRPDWSPDGSLFLLPAAELWVEDKPRPGAYLFSRSNISQPFCFLPTQKPVVCARFCQKLFKQTQSNWIDAKYKLLFALATTDSIYIYTTDSPNPVGYFGNIHYAPITDITFRHSNVLGISSSDGFCSFIKFEDQFLGEVLTDDQLPEHIKNIMNPPKQEKEEELIQPTPPKPVTQQQNLMVMKNGQQKKVIVPSIIA